MLHPLSSPPGYTAIVNTNCDVITMSHYKETLLVTKIKFVLPALVGTNGAGGVSYVYTYAHNSAGISCNYKKIQTSGEVPENTRYNDYKTTSLVIPTSDIINNNQQSFLNRSWFNFIGMGFIAWPKDHNDFSIFIEEQGYHTNVLGL